MVRSFAFLVVAAITGLPPAATLSAEDDQPSDKQIKLLKLFLSEFVEIKPDTKKFPDRFFYQGEREVQLTNRFAVAKFEVPQNLWEAVAGSNPSRWKGERNSVEMLSFSDAVAFCNESTRLMRAAKLIGDHDFVRLPTEIEWEYCARAGTTTAYSFGDDQSLLTDYAWYTLNAAGNDPSVGEKKPNPWDLYDVHGYLWEWTIRCEEKDASVTIDEEQWKSFEAGKSQILRGGSWKDPAEKLTCKFRREADVKTKDDAVGLRCVLIYGNADSTSK